MLPRLSAYSVVKGIRLSVPRPPSLPAYSGIVGRLCEAALYPDILIAPTAGRVRGLADRNSSPDTPTRFQRIDQSVRVGVRVRAEIRSYRKHADLLS